MISGKLGAVVRGAVTAAAVLTAVAGCGVSTNDQPEPIANENVPAELLETEIQPLPAEPTTGDHVTLWFLQTDDEGTHLEQVDRLVPPPAGEQLRLEALLEGPTAAENRDGISTAIPSTALMPEPPEIVDGVLWITLSDVFYELRGDSMINAAAQVVYTATSIPGIEGVQFVQENDEPINVLNGEGESTEGPLGPADYENLAP